MKSFYELLQERLEEAMNVKDVKDIIDKFQKNLDSFPKEGKNKILGYDVNITDVGDGGIEGNCKTQLETDQFVVALRKKGFKVRSITPNKFIVIG